VIPDHIREFIGSTVKSIWSLEALLLLRVSGDKIWTAAALSIELRGAVQLAQDILDGFLRAGILTRDDAGYRYAPADRRVEGLIDELAKLNVAYPLAVAKEVIRAPNDKIRTFVDAFRIKKD
jgi:hypothetical protein